MKHATSLSSIIVIFACLGVLAGCRSVSGAPADAEDGIPPAPVEELVTNGLAEPVSLVFLSPTVMLVAERSAGRIRWIDAGVPRQTPFASVPVPQVSGYHEYGVLGLAVDPNYPARPYVYAFHTYPDAAGRPAGQRVVRFTVRDGMGVEPHTIIDGLPVGSRCCHHGGRLVFGHDNKLYVTLGDTERPEVAQNYEALPGKILRYNPDGTIPEDNPLEQPRTAYAGRRGATSLPRVSGLRTPVFTIGHRNPFGITVDPGSGDLYITENGPERNDEINRLVAGDDYGWPEVMGVSEDPRFHNPIWASGAATLVPTGLAFYTGSEFPQFVGNLFFAAYADGRLRRVVITDEGTPPRVDVIPQAADHARLDVVMSPDGRLYYSSTTAIYRLRPAPTERQR